MANFVAILQIKSFTVFKAKRHAEDFKEKSFFSHPTKDISSYFSPPFLKLNLCHQLLKILYDGYYIK